MSCPNLIDFLFVSVLTELLSYLLSRNKLVVESLPPQQRLPEAVLLVEEVALELEVHCGR